MHQWFLSYDGRQVGPLDQAAAVAHASANPNGFCWRQGFAEWIPIASCPELCAESAPGNLPMPAPPPPAPASRSDQIDYRIFGEDMQFVEVELDPGESAIAEAGSSRLAGRMFSAAYQRGGSKDEGSVLGGLGGLISGDRGF